MCAIKTDFVHVRSRKIGEVVTARVADDEVRARELLFSRKVAEMTGSRFTPFFAIATVSLLVGFIVFWFSHTIVDPDLWGHIRFGQDILRTGSIIQNDTYSYRTGGQAWINHEWLSEVIFASLYDRSGPAGLIAFKILVSSLILGLSYAHLRRGCLGPLPSVLLLVSISIPFRMGLATIRPQVFTYLLFLTQLFLLESARGARQYRLWLLPVLFAVWVNLHGGVLAGIGVLGIWAMVRAVGRLQIQPGRIRQGLVDVFPVGSLCVVCGLALLLNPYRAALVEFLIKKGTVARPDIAEWAPMGLLSLAGLLDLGLLALGILGVIFTARKREPASMLILCVTAVLPFFSQRHYPLFALALVFLAGEHIADVWNRWLRPVAPRFENSRSIGFVCLAGSILFFGLSARRLGCIRIDPHYFPFPARAVALLERSSVRGNIAVPFSWGEYVIWHLGPGIKVSIDGRRETVYSDERYRQSLDFSWGTGAWDALLAEATTDIVLAPNGSRTGGLMSRKDGWAPLYKDTFSVLFAREGFSGRDRILETPIPALPDNGGGLCFPDPGTNFKGSSDRRARSSSLGGDRPAAWESTGRVRE
jgi:hypothetical protein